MRPNTTGRPSSQRFPSFAWPSLPSEYWHWLKQSLIKTRSCRQLNKLRTPTGGRSVDHLTDDVCSQEHLHARLHEEKQLREQVGFCLPTEIFCRYFPTKRPLPCPSIALCYSVAQAHASFEGKFSILEDIKPIITSAFASWNF